MNIKQIKKKAMKIRESSGGTIFVTPLSENDPFSKYSITYYIQGKYNVYPEALDVSEAAGYTHDLIQMLMESGISVNYDDDVRFSLYEAQLNAPDIRMRKLKNNNQFLQKSAKPLLVENEDVYQNPDNKEDYYFSPVGTVKFVYLSSVDDKKPKSIKFMEEYYKILSSRKYGKTASAIRQEVRRKTKSEAIDWIERTYKKYIRNDYEILSLLNSLR